VTIPVKNDLKIEPDETVNLSLVNPTGGAVLGTQQTATLTILDRRDDLLFGLEDPDFIVGNNISEIVAGNAGDDSLFGGEGDDILNGGEGDDSLFGEEGDDILNGGEGSDILYGNEGSDILLGGEGSDIFAIELDRGRDIIMDFTDGIDRIGLSSGITLEELTVGEGNHSIIIQDDNSQAIALLSNVDVYKISTDDFIAI
jgi:Ca2+-binding RTX toxin-like protein